MLFCAPFHGSELYACAGEDADLTVQQQMILIFAHEQLR